MNLLTKYEILAIAEQRLDDIMIVDDKSQVKKEAGNTKTLRQMLDDAIEQVATSEQEMIEMLKEYTTLNDLKELRAMA